MRIGCVSRSGWIWKWFEGSGSGTNKPGQEKYTAMVRWIGQVFERWEGNVLNGFLSGILGVSMEYGSQVLRFGFVSGWL